MVVSRCAAPLPMPTSTISDTVSITFNYFFPHHFNYFTIDDGRRATVDVNRSPLYMQMMCSFFGLRLQCMGAMHGQRAAVSLAMPRWTDTDKTSSVFLSDWVNVSVHLRRFVSHLCIAYITLAYRRDRNSISLPFEHLRASNDRPNRLFASINWRNQMIVTSALDGGYFWCFMRLCGARHRNGLNAVCNRSPRTESMVPPSDCDLINIDQSGHNCDGRQCCGATCESQIVSHFRSHCRIAALTLVQFHSRLSYMQTTQPNKNRFFIPL